MAETDKQCCPDMAFTGSEFPEPGMQPPARRAGLRRIPGATLFEASTWVADLDYTEPDHGTLAGDGSKRYIGGWTLLVCAVATVSALAWLALILANAGKP